MKDFRKQAVSLRVNHADVRKVKLLAQRRGVRESDVIRFGLKTMLRQLAPLCDPNVRGSKLLPVFMDAGGDFFSHFDLDVPQVMEIVNAGVPASQLVEADDLAMIMAAGRQESSVRMRPQSDMTKTVLEPRDGADDDRRFGGRLRCYLNSKYSDNPEHFNEPARRDVTTDG